LEVILETGLDVEEDSSHNPADWRTGRGGRGLDVNVGEDANNHARPLTMRGVFLLFSRGSRPDRAAIYEFVESHPSVSLTLDPARRHGLRVIDERDTASSVTALQGAALAEDRIWVELLRDGLTFDLEGLAPGAGLEPPETNHRFDCDDLQIISEFEAVRLVAGGHMAGGEAILPVLRGMLALARDLVQHFEHARAIAWPPSSSVIGRRYFESTMAAWLEGGAFPALGLTAFREMAGGGIQSVGLDFLIGQELFIEPELVADKVAATRLGVRLINQLVLAGAVERPEQIIGPEGQHLRLEPSADCKLICVRAG